MATAVVVACWDLELAPVAAEGTAGVVESPHGRLEGGQTQWLANPTANQTTHLFHDLGLRLPALFLCCPCPCSCFPCLFLFPCLCACPCLLTVIEFWHSGATVEQPAGRPSAGHILRTIASAKLLTPRKSIAMLSLALNSKLDSESKNARRRRKSDGNTAARCQPLKGYPCIMQHGPWFLFSASSYARLVL